MGAFKIVATPVKVVTGEGNGHRWLPLLVPHQPAIIFNAPINTGHKTTTCYLYTIKDTQWYSLQ